jgi:hypothetical protein
MLIKIIEITTHQRIPNFKNNVESAHNLVQGKDHEQSNNKIIWAS